MQRVEGRDPHTGRPLKVAFDGGVIQEAVVADGDGAGPYLSYGFLDIQVNGFLGRSFSVEPKPQKVYSTERRNRPLQPILALRLS